MTDLSLQLSPYLEFERSAWAALRADTPLTLTEQDLEKLRGLNEDLSLTEVEQIYLPLSRLLSLYVEATQTLHRATSTFLSDGTPKVPYIIGLAGSVAVGKSTTARVLQSLLQRWEGHPKVELVTTDGFLYPNAVLEARGIMERKGFPESYDLRLLLAFLSDVKAGRRSVQAPTYSHLVYDVMPGVFVEVDQPDILIVEGLNVLQSSGSSPGEYVFVSDYFDFSIYLDAEEELIESWFLARFFKLRETAFKDPTSHFHHFASLTDDEARRVASDVWRNINGKNLRENILPTRGRANLILEKTADHAIERVHLRKL